MLPVLHAARALTPEGWKSDVRVTIEDGAIAAVETGALAQEGDERHAIMAPAAANLHSHAFQRAMAGLAEVRGAGTRHVLDVARDDVSLRAHDVAGRRRGGRGAALCRDAGGGLRRGRRVPLSPSRARRFALRRAGGNGRPHPLRGPTRRHRHDAASGVLRPFDLRRRAAQAGAEAVHQRCLFLRAPRRRLPRDDQGRIEARRSASRRTASAP